MSSSGEHDSQWKMKARIWPMVIQSWDLSFMQCLYFINTTAYHLGRYEPSSSSTKELHGQSNKSRYDRCDLFKLMTIVTNTESLIGRNNLIRSKIPNHWVGLIHKQF